MIKAYNIHYTYLLGEHLWTPLYEQITMFNLFGYLFWLKRITVHQPTQSLCYNIPFHLYFMIKAYNKHSLHLLGEHVWTPLYKQLYLTYSVTFFWLKPIPILQLTQSLCYEVSFHLYIHDQGLQQTFNTLTCCVNMYVRLPFFGSNEYQSTN